jgi:hypothetical protein
VDVVIEGQIKGSFRGSKQGAVFVVNRGRQKKWQQVEPTYRLRTMFRPTSGTDRRFTWRSRGWATWSR